MNELAKLKQDVIAFCERRKANGGNVGEYVAPCCGAKLLIHLPNDDKDKWDSAVRCYECGELHLVVMTAKGANAWKPVTNQERAEWALTAVEASAEATDTQDEELGTKIGDLLANLMHLCDKEDVSFVDVLEQAKRHYEEERIG